jgi:hypothetical protein
LFDLVTFSIPRPVYGKAKIPPIDSYTLEEEAQRSLEFVKRYLALERDLVQNGE